MIYTHRYLEETRMLDYGNRNIADLVKGRFSNTLVAEKRMEEIYYFVRDEIRFGFNVAVDLPASRVLSEGRGTGPTKTTLLLALARSVGVPCRVRYFKIHKRVYGGILSGRAYERRLPEELLHSWPDVLILGRWLALEGVVLDRPYMERIRSSFSKSKAFEGFGVSVEDLSKADTDWRGEDTYIQRGAITGELGVFSSPDEFFASGDSRSPVLRSIPFVGLLGRKALNSRIDAIRLGKTMDQKREEQGGQ